MRTSLSAAFQAHEVGNLMAFGWVGKPRWRRANRGFFASSIWRAIRRQVGREPYGLDGEHESGGRPARDEREAPEAPHAAHEVRFRPYKLDASVAPLLVHY